MCDHFLGFHTHYRMQQPRVLWRCGACGRQSSAPIDCCMRPDFASFQPLGTITLCVRWLKKLGVRVLTGIPGRFHRRRRFDVDVTVASHRLTHDSVTRLAVVPRDDAQWIDTAADAEADAEGVGETTHVSVGSR